MVSSVVSWFYETYIPARFVLDDGTEEFVSASVVEERLSREPLFLLYVPPQSISSVVSALRGRGFVEEPGGGGELYSLVRRLEDQWELRLRIFSDGFIEAVLGVEKSFADELGDIRLFVVYEPFGYYSQTYDRLHIFYKPREKWLVKVLGHLFVRIRPPRILAPWRTVTASYEALTVAGPILYALSRLERGAPSLAVPA